MKKELYFDENSFPSAETTLRRYAVLLNQLAQSLTPFRIDISPEAIKRILSHGDDEVARMIYSQREKEMKNLPDYVRKDFQERGAPNLFLVRQILQDIRNETDNLLIKFRQSGRPMVMPIEFLTFTGGQFCPDLEALRAHFTVYSIPELEKVLSIADEAAKAFNNLRKTLNRDKLFGEQNILVVDRVTGEMRVNLPGIRFIGVF